MYCPKDGSKIYRITVEITHKYDNCHLHCGRTYVDNFAPRIGDWLTVEVSTLAGPVINVAYTAGITSFNVCLEPFSHVKDLRSTFSNLDFIGQKFDQLDWVKISDKKGEKHKLIHSKSSPKIQFDGRKLKEFLELLNNEKE